MTAHPERPSVARRDWENPSDCADSLPARASGEWARTKLKFLDDYIPPALAVTHNFRRRWFLDLFAGPGCNYDRDRNSARFPGSPLRAMSYWAPRDEQVSFTDAVFINKKAADHTTLTARVTRKCEAGSSLIPLNRIRIHNADSNQLLPSVMENIPPRDYVFAFADITGIDHWPFESVQRLKSQGHTSVDFYMLFPLEMTLIRKLSYEEEMTERYAAGLTAFFGGDDWRPLHRSRRTPPETAQLKRDITDLYLEKLRSVWSYAEVQTSIAMAENRPLYRMVFASNHPIASELARWQKQNGQRDLFG